MSSSLRGNIRGLVWGAAGVIWLSLFALLCGFPILAAAQSPQQLPGYISGTVVDQAGTAAVGAQVVLTRPDQSPKQQVLTGDNGQFSFADVLPGPFQLTVTGTGFQAQAFSGVVHTGEAYIVPAIELTVARLVTEVRVGQTQEEVAQIQIEEQEKQRVLGFIPNFYVSYVPDAAPLVKRQKYALAWKSMIDPFTFVGIGALAGFEHAADDFGGYGQGAQGYAKRYGAAYADAFAGTFISSAILPSLLKQDPRYFYKGTGSVRSRTLYALANAVICKGDNKRWQPNYSGILGSFAAGGISYLYYPANDRNASNLVVQNSLIGIAEGAVGNIFQEFAVRKLTPHLQHHPAGQP